MKLRTSILGLAACILTIPAAAENSSTPYAGQQTRAIKALSDEDVASLQEGE
jgi:hypothetical protein